MKVNGLTIPLAFVIPALLFTFWLGGLSITVFANDEEQEKHEEQPGHTQTLTDMATVKANVEAVQKSIDRLELQRKEDKDEILEAIRSQ